MKMLRYILSVVMTLLVSSCANDGYVGTITIEEKPISFSTSTGIGSRAEGIEAAALLGNRFVVYGEKELSNADGSTSSQTVFPGYVVAYEENSANTTESNRHGWEYVLDYQTIKYWDFAATTYRFNAYSLGKGATENASTSYATVSNARQDSCTFTGSEAQLSTCYVSDRNSISTNSLNGTQSVRLSFKSIAARLRFAFYETIPGYAVKEVKFYIDDATPLEDCSMKGEFITFGSHTAKYTTDGLSSMITPTETQPTHAFGELVYQNAVPSTYLSAEEFVGTLSSAPTYAKGNDAGYYTRIIAYPGNNKPLQLKVSYILASTDDSGQEIPITDAEATVPAEFCRWNANYSYTYLFKLTDDKLKPITFDAYSIADNTSDNQQGTITTVGQYSITTYQVGSTDNQGVGYKPGVDIEVAVFYNGSEQSGMSNVELNSKDGTSFEDGKTYPKNYVLIYHQVTTDEWKVENNTPDKTTPSSGLYKETVERISEGRAVFNPDMTGTYRIEFWQQTDTLTVPSKLAVKIVKCDASYIEINNEGTDNNYRHAPKK